MSVLLYKLSGRPTGRQIASGLGVSFGTARYFRANPPGAIAIRWGGAELADKDTPGTINRAECIRAASSKIATFRRLASADVPIPRFTTHRDEAREWEATVFGRTSEGFQGRGIRVYPHGEAQHADAGGLGAHELYTEYIPNDREYRLHVCNGGVVSVQRKYLEYPERRSSEFIKNVANGYAFKTPERDLNDSRKEAAINAVCALGLDFGAVDLIVDNDGKEYVLEVNTAPALSPMRVEQYLTTLRPLLAERR